MSIAGSTLKAKPIFVWALLLYVLVNVSLLVAAHKVPFTRRNLSEQGIVFQACDSATKQFLATSQPPQIVFLGSSLLVSALWSCDAKNYPFIANPYQHHKSMLLEKALDLKGLSNVSVFSFAVPGAMVSDAYLITNKLFKGQKKPCVIVYGLSPRDFMDDLMTGETRTAVFERLSEWLDIIESSSLYLATWQEKADFLLNNSVFLYGKRWRYQKLLIYDCYMLANWLLPASGRDGLGAKDPIAENFLASGAGLCKGAWTRSIEEYRTRYRYFNRQQFVKQRVFLEAFLKTTKQRRINVLLVNMPLTKENLQLMPSGLYNEYEHSLKAISNKYQVPLLDLQGKQTFDDASFYDTVHLNAGGGAKLVTILANWLAEHCSQRFACSAVK